MENESLARALRSIKAQALRDAADDWKNHNSYLDGKLAAVPAEWLRNRADQIELGHL